MARFTSDLMTLANSTGGTGLPIGSVVELAASSNIVDNKFVRANGSAYLKEDWPDLAHMFDSVDLSNLEFSDQSNSPALMLSGVIDSRVFSGYVYYKSVTCLYRTKDGVSFEIIYRTKYKGSTNSFFKYTNYGRRHGKRLAIIDNKLVCMFDTFAVVYDGVKPKVYNFPRSPEVDTYGMGTTTIADSSSSKFISNFAYTNENNNIKHDFVELDLNDETYFYKLEVKNSAGVILTTSPVESFIVGGKSILINNGTEHYVSNTDGSYMVITPPMDSSSTIARKVINDKLYIWTRNKLYRTTNGVEYLEFVINATGLKLLGDWRLCDVCVSSFNGVDKVSVLYQDYRGFGTLISSDMNSISLTTNHRIVLPAKKANADSVGDASDSDSVVVTGFCDFVNGKQYLMPVGLQYYFNVNGIFYVKDSESKVFDSINGPVSNFIFTNADELTFLGHPCSLTSSNGLYYYVCNYNNFTSNTGEPGSSGTYYNSFCSIFEYDETTNIVKKVSKYPIIIRKNLTSSENILTAKFTRVDGHVFGVLFASSDSLGYAHLFNLEDSTSVVVISKHYNTQSQLIFTMQDKALLLFVCYSNEAKLYKIFKDMRYPEKSVKIDSDSGRNRVSYDSFSDTLYLYSTISVYQNSGAIFVSKNAGEFVIDMFLGSGVNFLSGYNSTTGAPIFSNLNIDSILFVRNRTRYFTYTREQSAKFTNIYKISEDDPYATYVGRCPVDQSYSAFISLSPTESVQIRSAGVFGNDPNISTVRLTCVHDKFFNLIRPKNSGTSEYLYSLDVSSSGICGNLRSYAATPDLTESITEYSTNVDPLLFRLPIIASENNGLNKYIVGRK